MQDREPQWRLFELGGEPSVYWFAVAVRVVAWLVLLGTAAVIILRFWDVPSCLAGNVETIGLGQCYPRRFYVEEQILTLVQGLFFGAVLFAGAHALEQLAGPPADEEAEAEEVEAE